MSRLPTRAEKNDVEKIYRVERKNDYASSLFLLAERFFTTSMTMPITAMIPSQMTVAVFIDNTSFFKTLEELWLKYTSENPRGKTRLKKVKESRRTASMFRS